MLSGLTPWGSADFDAVLAPSAPGVAPFGRWPGNPLFNAYCTAMQMPVVNMPMQRDVGALPLGSASSDRAQRMVICWPWLRCLARTFNRVL